MRSEPKIYRKRTIWTEWHDWFAWRPVKALSYSDVAVGEGSGYCWAWLETIERRIEFYYADNEHFYRVKNNS